MNDGKLDGRLISDMHSDFQLRKLPGFSEGFVQTKDLWPAPPQSTAATRKEL